MNRFCARLLIVLLAGVLQFHQLGRDIRFHPDEASFMTYARNAAVNGDWLLPGALDKPPLSIYLGAISMVATGLVADDKGVLRLDPLAGEFAARLPNVIMAILLVALMMRLSRSVFSDEAAALAAGLLTALSPYVLAFGATAFTDLGLLFFSTLAWYWLECQGYRKAGLALGLAFWCKQQALLLLPLVLLLLWTNAARRAATIRLAQPLALLALLLFVWDAARPATSVFLLGSVNNLPAQWIADPAEWPGRLLEWARLGIWLLGPPVVTLSLIGLAVLSRFARGAAPRRTSHSQVYLLYVIAYVALHTLLAFNQYDRYLLPLLPPMILVVSSHLPALPRGRLWKSLSLSLAIALVLAALWSLGNGLPIGGDRGRHDGIEDLARYLNSKPVATVIYDPWLGWELGYYLGQWHDKRRVHYPTAETLAEGALALDEIGDRYLVALVDHGHEDWIAALKTAGFVLSLDYEQNRYIVYRISRPG
ncbi:MAG: glycosyltransferase family 39 protein [Chloroflexota bacterium]|nr:glycosyltransferase family 39 protein [Chloroflexota bacterium]